MKQAMSLFMLAAAMAGSVYAQQLSTTPDNRLGEGWWKDRFAQKLAQVKQQARQVDLHRADVTTGAAQAAGIGQCVDVGYIRVQQTANHGADRSAIGAAVGVPADLTIDRANI